MIQNNFPEAVNSAAQLLTGRSAENLFALLEDVFEDQLDHLETLTLREDDDAANISLATVRMVNLRDVIKTIQNLKNQN